MASARGRTVWLLAASVALALAALACWQRTPALTWYYLRELAAADAQSQARWVKRVVGLDTAAVPGLLEQLESKDPTVCNNTRAALVALVQRWGPEDARTQALVDTLRARFTGASPLGQIVSLEVVTAVLSGDGPRTWPAVLTRAAGDLLHTCQDRPELRTTALVLAGVLLERVPPGQWLDPCRILADRGLSDRFERARLAAVQLVMRAPLQGEPALLAKIVPLLCDKAVPVRRAALVALASARELVSDDELLPLLHDPDLEVQHLCAAALRSRDLSEAHLDMARLISDESPKARLKVIERLGRIGDLDPSAWLRRLSQDPCSAVRAAAVRAAAQHPRVDLGDRLRAMAQQDPSETVRQNARYYLAQRTATPAGGP